MILVLDSGGVTGLVRYRERLDEVRRRNLWPAQVPVVVLTEVLTGDGRRDAAVNRLLRLCEIRPITEEVAREAGRLRTRSGRAGEISAVDAIVAAFAGSQRGEALVLTSDPDDLRDLCRHGGGSVRVART